MFMVNNLVFRWPKPLFFMVLGAHGIFYLQNLDAVHPPNCLLEVSGHHKFSDVGVRISAMRHAQCFQRQS